MSDENKPQSLTEEQRAEIRRRWSGVSLGDWSHGLTSLRCNAITCDGQYLFLVVHPDLFKNERALEFLAHARQDMHALLQEVERLQKKIEELKETAERDDLDGQIVLGEADKLAKALADNRICAYNVDDDGIAGAQEECSRLNNCRECWRAYAHEQVMAEIESEGE